MTLGYSRSGMVLGLNGQRLGLGLTEIQHGFELYECLLVFISFAHIYDSNDDITGGHI